MKPLQTLITALLLFTLLATGTGCSSKPHPLREKLEKIIRNKKADIGIAVVDLEDGDTLSIHGSQHYPMQSVFKFPLALAVLDQVDKGKLRLDQVVHIGQKYLFPSTWSPLRDRYPDEDADLPLAELLAYTVSQSDNNGCDALFRILGGTGKVNEYVHGLGIKDMSIAATEEEMSQGWEVQYLNWSTPRAAAQLLEKMYATDILSKKSREFLYRLMVETSTGPNRIKGMLPPGAEVAHKTGTGGFNNDDNAGDMMLSATNDIGIMKLPNGHHVILTVFVTGSMEGYDPKLKKPEEIEKKINETNEKLIAEIARATWDYFLSRPGQTHKN